MSTVIGVRGIRKVFLAVYSMIVTGFLMKSYKKLREKPDTEEEVYEDHLKIERHCADARPTIARMDVIFTPRGGDLIDSLMQMAPGRFA